MVAPRPESNFFPRRKPASRGRITARPAGALRAFAATARPQHVV